MKTKIQINDAGYSADVRLELAGNCMTLAVSVADMLQAANNEERRVSLIEKA